MATITKENSKQKLLAGITAVALAVGLGVTALPVAQAQAAEATTGIYLQADDAKIIASAPTRIDVAVNGDGSFVTPSADSLLIENGSVFAIHVSDMKATALNDFNFVTESEAASAASENNIWMTVQPGSGAASELADAQSGLALTDSAWAMTKAGSAGDSVALTTEGGISNITKDLAASQQFGQIDWTFAAGGATI